ncbi:cAMP and cAMP-inhibited cGMP 3',5'-cyclic phosphodiesterase 10A-like [Sitophilus oryzae]|uniref:cAMP and cAMP-inhibited cGMP 3',5'-cyclic phosphodiesterase 10A-like n=1 Tax=Sitophilus oryzae TaxID=7048 RepID=A0A6J2Y7C4_SITOR|nr:cAMP and cAMP-inhibited cGMP 3',5'-cyclic phosphodiesterase 10A-like [Sitophilus oryzae]
MHKTGLLNESNMQLLSLQIKPCSHDIMNFLENTEVNIPSGFDDFRWYISVEEEPIMPQMVYHMLKTVVGFTDMNIGLLVDFILTVRKCYRPNPYHNWEHAFNVSHCMYNILLRNPALFTEVEVIYNRYQINF